MHNNLMIFTTAGILLRAQKKRSDEMVLESKPFSYQLYKENTQISSSTAFFTITCPGTCRTPELSEEELY